MHRGLSCRRHRRLKLAVEQSPRVADVISGEIQHGRGYLLPVPTDRDCEAPTGGMSSYRSLGIVRTCDGGNISVQYIALL